MNNSNPTDKKGLDITEGSKVFWTNPDRYESNGYYIIDSAEGDFATLKRADGTTPDYKYADFNDLKVVV